MTNHKQGNSSYHCGQCLAEKYRLKEGVELDDLLTAISSTSYGAFSPDENDAPLRRFYGTETLDALRQLSALARHLEELQISGFSGAQEFAVADYAGVSNMDVVSAAIRVLADVTERKRPLTSSRRLGQLIVWALGGHWNSFGGEPDRNLFERFVVDALYGRRRFPAAMIKKVVGELCDSVDW